MGAAEGTLQHAPISESADCVHDYSASGSNWSCQRDAAIKPKLAKMGPAGPDTKPTTLVFVLEKAASKKKLRLQKDKKKGRSKTAKERGDTIALRIERPSPQSENGNIPEPFPVKDWTVWTYKQYREEVVVAASGFIVLGFQRFDAVTIWGFNMPEWHMTALAAMHAGGKCAGVYPSDSAETAAHKVVHSGARIVVIDIESRLDKLVDALNARRDCKHVEAFVAYGFEPKNRTKVDIEGLGDIPLLSWADLLEKGRDCEEDLARRIKGTKSGHCAFLNYTSGTTGEPKAVMLAHDALFYEATTLIQVLQESVGFADARVEERLLSYLPLANVTAFLLDLVLPLVAHAYKDGQANVFFARPDELNSGSIYDRLRIAKPTVFLGFPAVWENIAVEIRSLVDDLKGLKKSACGAAKYLALKRARNKQIGGSGLKPLGFKIADVVVLSRARAKLGLEECKVALTATAPARINRLQYFASIGLDLHEVYGLSECTGACTISTSQAHQWGSVGYQIPGVEIKIFKVDPSDFNKKTECPPAPSLDDTDEKYLGEICFRGRNTMMGYLASPDMGEDHVENIRRINAQTIDSEGWLHTDDQGLQTELGMIKVLGRRSEIITTGENDSISPVWIEDEIKTQCDAISEAMVIRNGYSYCVALVTLKAVGANGESPGTDELDRVARKLNKKSNVKLVSQAIDDDVFIDTIEMAMASVSKNTRCNPNGSFTIRKFTILPTNFSQELDELTPTKVLKRKAIEKIHSSIIERLFSAEIDGYVRYM